VPPRSFNFLCRFVDFLFGREVAMFYSVASPDWKPGQPLAPAGALLFRTLAEAASFAPDAVVVAVAVEYDATKQTLRAQGHGGLTVGRWSARAVGNRLGGIIVFGTIPAALLRSTIVEQVATTPALEAEARPTECYGWDSLTMALLA